MEIAHLGSGICSQSWRITGAIFCETRPAMIIRSACRGEGRNTSAPKRAISKREAPMAIISMAQQARPNVMGQMELLRTQFTALSNVVRMRPSGGSSPKVTVRMRLASCSLPTVFSKRSSPFIALLYYPGSFLWAALKTRFYTGGYPFDSRLLMPAQLLQRLAQRFLPLRPFFFGRSHHRLALVVANVQVSAVRYE